MVRIIAVMTITMTSLLLPTAARAQTAIPSGFRLVGQEQLAEGLEHLSLVRDKPPLAVNVARIAPGASVTLRVVLSNEAVFGPEPRKELTSSMCVRVDCVVAVNGDYSVLETGEPRGGVVIGGEFVRSPNSTHHQMTISQDSIPSAGPMQWSGTLMPSTLKQFQISGANIARSTDQMIVYTAAWGPSTETNEHGVEIVGEIVQPPPPLRVGQTSRIKLMELRDGKGNAPISPTGIVLSAHGSAANALKELWAQVESGEASREVLLRFETIPEAAESVGGTPVLVREGRRWDAPPGERHPRTLVGWTSDGWMWLVTVDGRQPSHSVGMSFEEAADFMIALGATEAINLDGGGSTTFVVRGAVVNRPSDRAVSRGGKEAIVTAPGNGDKVLGNVERPRPVAIAIVPKDQGTRELTTDSGGMDLPRTVALQLPIPAADPASNPTGGLPALIVPRGTENGVLHLTATVVNALAGLGFGAFLIWRRQRSSKRG